MLESSTIMLESSMLESNMPGRRKMFSKLHRRVATPSLTFATSGLLLFGAEMPCLTVAKDQKVPPPLFISAQEDIHISHFLLESPDFC